MCNDKSKDVRAPPVRKVMKTKAAKESLRKDPTPPIDDDSEKEEEEVTTRLVGGDLHYGKC